MKKSTKEAIPQALAWLDETYGTQKEGFYHEQPWQLLAAIMLSAQSTDRQVEGVLPTLVSRFPTAESVAEADVAAIEDCIRSVGLYQTKARNLKKCCAQIVEEFGGEVPKTLDGLLGLAGVGRKTGTLFLADAYGIEGVTVDTHVFRISRRLGWAKGKNPVQVERELMKALPKDHWNRINFQLIYHGRAVCRARRADCSSCGLAAWCEQGQRETCGQGRLEGGCNRTGAMV